ncbi:MULTISPECIES: DUF1841 family protein [unclassified Methylophilus]|jgi:hypothetical protein|uniref:DUF1841 family protein n=1 Tax=Methylophilus glucosoxydans TaxID=752553 RepID=A0ABW3GI35_9PROT|nr:MULTISPECIES: DUF1841 family protein [unclassified Methylophilus]MDF0377735.1 DUF1841 family protein [Methylophilus sp. YYY-1]MDT7849093.1 DUF1841 family protein [Methylophilus sp. VKM B-3414]BEV08962.1 DUF1841 family protein [Methylophilus sp. DW102]
MALFNPSRDEVRQFFFDAWAKFKQQQALTELEKMAVGIMHMHPEYHDILDQPAHYLQQAYYPEMGETNPFLHMSLHLSIQEQISINQPIGITQAYGKLCTRFQEEHAAQHALLECLAETIWLAQRNQTGLDAAHYLQLIEQRADMPPSQ